MQEHAQQTDTQLTRACSPRVRRQQVYVISREGGGVKVGISGRPLKRKSQLQSASPEKLTITATYRPRGITAAEVEAEVKRLLAPLRLRGEWFSLPAEAMRIVVEAVIENDNAKRDFVERFVPYHQANMAWAETLRSRRGEDIALGFYADSLSDEIQRSGHHALLVRINPWWGTS